MKKSICITLFLCLAAIFFLSPQSHALMINLSIKELTKASEVIVKGKVVKTESYWSEDGDTIFTKAYIRIQTVIKGKVVGKKIMTEYEGGVVGDEFVYVSDMPELKKGEKVILFLKSKKTKDDTESGNVYEIVGNAQGKYLMYNDNIAGRYGFHVLDKEDAENEDNVPVDKLINKIRGAAK